jgi:hypothetical protein
MMAVNDFPDGCVLPEQFLPNNPAPEALLPQQHGEDLSWVATNANRAPGIQPKTAINPAGEMTGMPLSVHL